MFYVRYRRFNLAITIDGTFSNKNLKPFVWGPNDQYYWSTASYNIPSAVFTQAHKIAVPLLACRLLLNIQKATDPVVRTVVSTILFEPPFPSKDSQATDESTVPTEGAQYAGLGRQRDAGRLKQGQAAIEDNRPQGVV
ncbi:hypothetical protein DFP72DRAFT_1170653 [Ephemerocybe angulata]|uniref:Uncharacterized protein n=1 Tax=Ephemerocybe angulata TaxID=980116 RepID=A0A8H6HW11_9AGAR|nr:hypothetical protein DFP72DRAFT_1170653 [Tulosesus angulatus]